MASGDGNTVVVPALREVDMGAKPSVVPVMASAAA